MMVSEPCVAVALSALKATTLRRLDGTRPEGSEVYFSDAGCTYCSIRLLVARASTEFSRFRTLAHRMGMTEAGVHKRGILCDRQTRVPFVFIPESIRLELNKLALRIRRLSAA